MRDLEIDNQDLDEDLRNGFKSYLFKNIKKVSKFSI